MVLEELIFHSKYNFSKLSKKRKKDELTPPPFGILYQLSKNLYSTHLG